MSVPRWPLTPAPPPLSLVDITADEASPSPPLEERGGERRPFARRWCLARRRKLPEPGTASSRRTTADTASSPPPSPPKEERGFCPAFLPFFVNQTQWPWGWGEGSVCAVCTSYGSPSPHSFVVGRGNRPTSCVVVLTRCALARIRSLLSSSIRVKTALKCARWLSTVATRLNQNPG